jgi:hypothetical protein
MPNYHTPIITEKATEIYRSITIECERRRQELSLPMWKLDDLAGTQDGFYAKMLHADRPSGRQCRWETLNLIVSALWPQGFDLQIIHKPGDPLTAENHRLKVMFAASDHCRLSRRKLMSELGKRGAAARLAKLGKRERKKIAKHASKIAAIKRSKRAAPQSQTQSAEVT